jgi:hypothetical protein
VAQASKRGRGGGKKPAGSFNKKQLGRPNFPAESYRTAVRQHNLNYNTAVSIRKPELSRRNAALPHRTSFDAIRARVLDYLDGGASETEMLRWTNRMLSAGQGKIRVLRVAASQASDGTTRESIDEIIDVINRQTNAIKRDRATLVAAVTSRMPVPTILANAQSLLARLNSYHPNIPDLGPHSGVNIQVRQYTHLHVRDGSLTPGSVAAVGHTPGSVPGVAFTPRGTHIATTTGEAVAPGSLPRSQQQAVARHVSVPRKVRKGVKWG